MAVPETLRTARLLLRPWRREDARELQPILEANGDHLSPWIPARIARAAPLPELEARLEGFAADFAASREWRWAIVDASNHRLLGEVSLFPRDILARVALERADRAEVGYWLRQDATGQGFVTEAVRAVLAAAARMGKFEHIEIRCDVGNEPSNAIPRRLGFAVASTVDDQTPQGMAARVRVWTSRAAEV